MTITITLNFYLLTAAALFISLTANLFFIFFKLADRFPNIFYEDLEENN